VQGRTPTATEKKWLSEISQLNCIVCKNMGLGESPADIHHIDGSRKENAHLKTIPICPPHHRTGGYGIALHAGRAEWEKRYGTQQQLLKQVQEIIK